MITWKSDLREEQSRGQSVIIRHLGYSRQSWNSRRRRIGIHMRGCDMSLPLRCFLLGMTFAFICRRALSAQCIPVLVFTLVFVLSQRLIRRSDTHNNFSRTRHSESGLGKISGTWSRLGSSDITNILIHFLNLSRQFKLLCFGRLHLGFSFGSHSVAER